MTERCSVFRNDEIYFDKIGDLTPSDLNYLINSKLYLNRIKSVTVIFENDDDIDIFSLASLKFKTTNLKNFWLTYNKRKKNLISVLSNMPDGSTVEIKSEFNNQFNWILSFSNSVIRVYEKDRDGCIAFYWKTFTFKAFWPTYEWKVNWCNFSEDSKYSEYLTLDLAFSWELLIEDLKLIQSNNNFSEIDGFIPKFSCKGAIVISLKDLNFTQLGKYDCYEFEQNLHWIQKIK